MIVYKYRRNAKTTDSIFTDRKVWLSTPVALNDPFETEISFGDNFNHSISEMREMQLSAFLEAARNHRMAGRPFYGLRRNDTYALIERFKKLRDKNKAYQAYSDFIEQRTGSPPLNLATTYTSIPQQLSSIGIFSLSETSDNSLMWAHYGEDHHGICIGFEVTDDSALANSDHCLHVKYSNTTPRIDEVIEMERQMSTRIDGRKRPKGAIALSHPLIQATIATKGVEWAYEREWRYVEFASGEYDWPAPIVEITFGLRCNPSQRDHYLTLLKSYVPNDVRLYEIRKISGTKSIERVMIGVASALASDSPLTSDLVQVQRLLHNRNFVAAITAVDQLLSTEPNLAEAWRCKGIGLGWLEDHAGALKCFDTGLSIEPGNFSLHYQKAVALMFLGRFEESIEEHKRAHVLCAWEPSFPFNLGVLLLNLDRSDEAIVQLKIASSLGHPRANEMIARLSGLVRPEASVE